MKTYTYTGWICRNLSRLCIFQYPPGHPCNETPALTDLISSNFSAGDYVTLRLMRYPNLMLAKWIGPLTITPVAIRVGSFHVLADLEAYIDRFVVVSVSTLPDALVDQLERLAWKHTCTPDGSWQTATSYASAFVLLSETITKAQHWRT